MKENHFDAIVVGSGFGGGSLNVLARKNPGYMTLSTPTSPSSENLFREPLTSVVSGAPSVRSWVRLSL